MTAVSISLLLLAGVCHAAWNVIAKRGNTSRDWLFTWAMAAGAIAFAPALFVARLPAACIALAAASAVVEWLYYLLLARAYERFDLAFVYPIARGTAPVFTAAASFLLMRDRLSPPGLLGILVIAAGVALCSARLGTARGAGALAVSLAIGASISSYTMIDAIAVRRASAMAYMELVFLFGAVLMLAVNVARDGLPRAAALLRATWPRALAVGLLMLAAYSLVLTVYRMAHVAYAAAVREVSIPMAAIAGVIWLKEPFARARLIGALMVTAGVVLIALSR